jgi:hypothetical protein
MRIDTERKDTMNMANHIPYGYRIENGVAVIDEGQAEQVRTLFSGYLSGLALVPAAEAAGLTLFHSGAKRILQNEHYLGDDFYPAIIDRETFSEVAEERNRRAGALGRIRERSTPAPCKAKTAFIIGKVTHRYDDPFKQAAYIYSLIESEVRNG